MSKRNNNRSKKNHNLKKQIEEESQFELDNQNGKESDEEIKQQSQKSVQKPQNGSNQNGEQDQTKSERIRIHVNYREVQNELYKNIEFYETIIDQPKSQIYQSLQEIISYDKSLPKFHKNEDFMTFIKFIVKLIEMADSIVIANLVSRKQQLSLFHSTIQGFLELQKLKQEISYRLNAIQQQTKKTKLNGNKCDKYQLNQFKNEFNQLNQTIEEYISEYMPNYQFFNRQDDQVKIPEFNPEENQYEIEENQIQIVENEEFQNEQEIYEISNEEKEIIKIEDLLVDELIASKLEVDENTKIVPDEQDCRVVKNYRKNLKMICIKTPYQNEKEYLENMLNYLKADSHQQLALGMNRAIKIGAKIKIQKTFEQKQVQKEIVKFRPLMSIFNFYNNVEIINMKYQKGLMLFLSVQPILPKQNYEIKWENSKRLIGDQFLYLTDYNFNKIYICQVSHCFQSNALQSLNSSHGIIKLNIKILTENYETQGEVIENIQTMVKYRDVLILEPREYYGQYFNCIRTIKDILIKQHKIPFVNNIIHLNKVINPPTFINEQTNYNLDFTHLSKDIEKNKGYQQTLLSDWSQIPTLSQLTNSQQKAVKNILTKEISLIQGPPGTGKTYVGAIAIRNLLYNSNVWNPNNNPIVMCCKTNHALDQFLGHIMKFEKSIVRIGSRSKDPMIKQFQLSEIRKKYLFQTSSFFKVKELEEKLNKSLSYLSNSLFNSKNFEEILKVYPEFAKACCQTYLYKYLQNLPLLLEKIHNILKDQKWNSLIQKYWWVLLPDVNEMLDDFFYPLIEQFIEDKQVKQDYKLQIEQIVYYFNSVDSTCQFEFYTKKYENYRKSQNYFYGDDTEVDDKKQLEQQKYNDLKLWSQIRLFKEQDEYAEDRENYIVNDDYDSDDDDDDDEKEQKEIKRREKQIKFSKNKKDMSKDIFYLSYFQFIDLDLEKWFNQIDVFIKDNEYYPMTLQDEIYSRLYAVIKYSQKMGSCLFSKNDISDYFDKLNKLKVELNYGETQVMKQHKIIAMTLSGACKYSEYLKHLNYQVVIIEEAGEVLENLTIPLLQPTLKQLILIGDHQQLKPTVLSYVLSKSYNMNVSLFERLIRNKIEYECLSEQMRMCPEFSQYVRLIYKQPNQYLDSDKVKNYIRDVRGLPSNIMFFMHDYQEKQLDHTTTKMNEQEADLAILFAKYIVYQKQYKPEEITILTMYLGQSSMIRKKCNECGFLKQVKICTVDNYQGEENEIIILSLVRSSNTNMGFTKICNRINVSISRAKKGFIILSNQNLLLSKAGLWANIFKLAQKNNHIYIKSFERKCSQHSKNLVYSTSSDFNRSTSGGCGQKCIKQNLTCKHKCMKECHEGECDEFECQIPYQRTFNKCGHTNQLKCFQRNMDESELKCMQMEKIKNDYCDHDQLIECYKYKEITKENPDQKLIDELNSIKCEEICNKIMICNHKCLQKCHESQGLKCQLQKCNEYKNEKMNCGHIYKGYCKDSILFKCNQKVKEKELSCGHKVLNVICSDNKKCNEPCIKVLDCGHKCIQQKCCESHFCDKVSKRKLPCGHMYYGSCSADLNKVECGQISNKLLSCGHGVNTNICFEASTFQCKQKKMIDLPCGHQAEDLCYKTSYLSEIKCEKLCQKIIECGHNCQKKCFEQCTQPNECYIRIDSKKRKDCVHRVTGQCHLLTQKCMVEEKKGAKKCYELQNFYK